MESDSEHWEQLQALFHLAGDTPEEELDALLEQACAKEELRSRARALILAARVGAEEPAPAGSAVHGNRIGPYTILRHLGSGGIGAVYLAERIAGGTVRRVAVKVLSLHAAGPFFEDRFAREQHILASLDHPNITRMLDAGISETGEPYLAMEYVDGVHLDVFCDDRSLAVADRLELFLQVCEAVAYAHRNLVVHLDLKPSNILVSEAEGVVKLLDFGTSKLIQPDSLLTTTVMATPAYASPEQLRNEAVTTACDVYALGAILFELLAGRRPNQDSSVAAMIERSMKELPPESLTAAVSPQAAERRGLTQTRLLNLLRGDLATIVAKCLSGRPKDRYASVDALITDVQRYLDGRPVLARPQTTTYRIGKFIRRNRTAVGAAAVLSVALLASLGYAAWRQQQAVRAGQRALQMQTFLYRLFKLANANYMGKPAASVPEFLQLGMKILPDFIKDPADLRAAQLGLAESMYDNNDYPDALKAMTQILASAKSSGDIGAEAEAEAYAGFTAHLIGQQDLSKQLLDHALSISHRPEVTPATRVRIEQWYVFRRENLGFRSDDDLKLLQSAVAEARSRHLPDRELANAIMTLAGDYIARGRPNEAEPLLKEAIAIYDKEPYALYDQANTYEGLGLVQDQRGDLKGARDSYQQAYEDLKTALGPEAYNTLLAECFLADDLRRMGQPQAAIAMIEPVMPRYRQLEDSKPELATPLKVLALSYLATGQFDKAEQDAEEIYAVSKGKINETGARMGLVQFILASTLAAQHRYREALPHAEIADTISSSVTKPGQTQPNRQEHQLLLDIRARLASESGGALPPQPARR
jgi:serine/threonine-protein kinase